MPDNTAPKRRFEHPDTVVTHAGRHPGAHAGFVSTPIYRGSTVLFASLNDLDDFSIRYRYGRQGTPLTSDLETVVSELEGAAGTVLAPSGMAAISLALLSCLEAGDEVLITDSVYDPTRALANDLLARLGITVRYFDPRKGEAIRDNLSERTRAIFLESPGSLTFELQDIPAIVQAVRGSDITVLVDNSWATPIYCNPLALGADLVIHAGTKMFAGHSDVMLGTVSANDRALSRLKRTHRTLGLTASPDDAFLTLRGLRTLGVRMKEHRDRTIEMAHWLEAYSDSIQVIHPALPSHPDHAIFARDFRGSGSLFAFILPPAPRSALAAMVDDLELFGMGYSWGGFESLLLPAKPEKFRSAVPWTNEGNLVRMHVGFESLDDLKADLKDGLDRYFKNLGM